MEMPTLVWSEAPDWANYHVYQAWGQGYWTEYEPIMGNHIHNHGRFWFALNTKATASNYTLPLGLDYRVSVERRPAPTGRLRPTVVCLCGSTRFSEAFQQAQLDETLAGKIVLTIGCNMKSDADLFAHMTQKERDDLKARLDELHLRKIDMSDEVLVLSADGYIGSSTRNEIDYALSLGKTIRWLEDAAQKEYYALAQGKTPYRGDDQEDA